MMETWRAGMGRWAEQERGRGLLEEPREEWGPRAPQIFSPLPPTPPGRPHQQRSAEGGRAADPAGLVQRGLPLPGDPPHAVRRLPQGQEGCLPGDSCGVGQIGERGRCSRHPGPAAASRQVGLAVPTLWMRKLRLGRLRDLLQVAGPRSEETPGGRAEAQAQLCSLPSTRRFAQVRQQKGLEPTEGRRGWAGRGDTHPRFRESQALLEARLGWFGPPPSIRGFQRGRVTQNIPSSRDPCLEGDVSTLTWPCLFPSYRATRAARWCARSPVAAGSWRGWLAGVWAVAGPTTSASTPASQV